MGRGLSKLQKLVLAEAENWEVVLFQEMLDKLCPKFNPLEHAGPKDRGETVRLFFDFRSKRKTQPWVWESVKENKDALPELRRIIVACEEHERKRRSVEAALSRVFTRLESRGLVERVDVARWTEDDKGHRVDERSQRGDRLTVKSSKGRKDLTDRS